MKTIERFLAKIEVQPDGCWYWTAAINRAYGYSAFTAEGRRMTSGHRWAYEYWVGPIPEGFHVDHDCHTRDLVCQGGPTCLHRRCVNPDHLVAMLPRDNVRLAVDRLGVCHNGHPRIRENVHVDRHGWRHCMECRRIRERVKR